MVTNCSDGGVLGPVPGVIGVLQALEALKILSESGEVLSGKLLLFDGISSNFRTIRRRNRSENANVEKLIDYEQVCYLESLFFCSFHTTCLIPLRLKTC